MKKVVFLFFTFISLVCYGFAIILWYTYYTEKNVGMPLLFFMPSLIIGLLSGLLAIGTKNFLKLLLSGFLATLHKINVVLLITGSCVFLYYFFSQ